MPAVCPIVLGAHPPARPEDSLLACYKQVSEIPQALVGDHVVEKYTV